MLLVILLLDITLIYHAAKTGRLQPWAFIILMVPLVGSLAYICVELVPEWFSAREVGRLDEALEEYHAVSAYFPGAEARVRYGLLLRMVGRTAEARIVFNELLLQMRRAPKYLRDAQAEWLAIAEKQLSARAGGP